MALTALEACSASSADSSAHPDIGQSAAALDFDFVQSTSYRVTIDSIDHIYAVDVDPSKLKDHFWTADAGYSDWAALAVKVNDDNPYTTACSLGSPKRGLGQCVDGAVNSAPFQAGQKLSARFSVANKDVATIAVSLDNIEVKDPKKMTVQTSSSWFPAFGDSTSGLAAAVPMFMAEGAATTASAGILGVFGAALSVTGDLMPPAPDNSHRSLFEVTCAGGLMGTSPPDSETPNPDTVFLPFTANELLQLTASGTARLGREAITYNGGPCYSLAYIYLTIERDWNTGPAPSPKSADNALTRHGTASDQIDQFMHSPNWMFNTIDRQWWDDTGWHSEPISGQSQYINDLTHIAAVSRSPDKMDVFWADYAGNVEQSSWSEATKSWKQTEVLSHTPNYWLNSNTNITAVARTPRNLDLFYIGRDGGIWTSFWYEGASSWTTIEIPGTANRASPGGGIAATARTSTNIDVFYIGNDGALWTSYWSEKAGWTTRSASEYQPKIAPPGGGVTAVSRSVNNLDVFFIGNDGSLYTTYWFAGAPDYVTMPIPGTAGLALPGSTASAVSRQPNMLDVAFSAKQSVYLSSWSGGPWITAPVTTSAPMVAANGYISLVARTSWNLDVFYTDLLTSDLYTAYWSHGMPSWGKVGPLPRVAPCVPTTCAAQHACGTIADGCGGTLNCGGCTSGFMCAKNTCTRMFLPF